MAGMFWAAASFDQDISNWKIKTTCDTKNMFYGCPIKEEYKPKFND
jgi:hypothetical protein